MTHRHSIPLTLALALALAGCRGDAESSAITAEPQAARETSDAELSGIGYETLTPEELERGRFDSGWQRAVQLDTLPGPMSAGPNTETWDSLSAEAVNRGPAHLPLHGDVAGPSVMAAQILLDRALFSPGIIDGRWGKNTEIAVYWFQRREGLPATGRIDGQTLQRLASASAGAPFIREHQLTADDVEGPFVRIPEDIYEKAEMECLCYESVEEKLAERFHTSPQALARLNPDVDLGSVSAGDRLRVPNIRDANAGRGASIQRIVISSEGHYLHALDGSGRIVYHFPTTLGSSYDPSPDGTHTVRSITRDPWWHYQPAILEHVDSSEPDARIPPGPNNAVGRVWMALSIPHYGIHGTSAPETIGYATSAGCVRLTNWDALFLADRIQPGVTVEFQEGSGRRAEE